MISESPSSDDLVAREIDARIVIAVEEERRRIASELHDNFGQELTSALILSQQLIDQLNDDTTVEIAERLFQINTRLASETRRLSNGLQPTGFLEIGLDFALNALAEGIDALGTTCRFIGTVDCQGIALASSLHLYRIAQEAAINAVKHSRADAILIRLTNADDESGLDAAQSAAIDLSIIDNGIGFANAQSREGHSGLANMQRHARMLGGTLAIGKNDVNEKGTVVTCNVRRTEIERRDQNEQQR